MLRRGDARTVTCIACGTECDRSDAREYDKQGDRWERRGKHFEYLCKPCFQDLSKVDRDGLEEHLVAAGAGERDQMTFLQRYLSLTVDGDEPDGRHD